MDANFSKDGITYLDEKKGIYRRKLDISSDEYDCLINTVKGTCVDPFFEDRFWRLDKLEFIRNEELENRYAAQRTIMAAKGLTDTEGREVYVFSGGSAKMCDEICKEGHKTGLKKRPVLGHTGQGIHFVQHYDILTRFLAFLQFKSSVHIVVYKAVLGKAKKVNICASKDNNPTLPDKEFNCFVAVKPVEPRMSINQAIDSSYVYLYDFDETSNPVRYPRRALPYAVIALERKPCVTLNSPFLAVNSGSIELRWEVKGETRRGFRWNITKKPASRQTLKLKVDQVRRRRSQSKEENQKQSHVTEECPPVLNRFDNELTSKEKASADEPPVLDKHTKLDYIVKETDTKKERIQQIQQQRNTRDIVSSPSMVACTDSYSAEHFANISSESGVTQPLMSYVNVTKQCTATQKAGGDSDKCVDSEICQIGKEISNKIMEDSLQSEFWRNGELDLLKVHTENSYTRTNTHRKTLAHHSVPRNLPSSLKPFINLTRIDSSGSNNRNKTLNSQYSQGLPKSSKTTREKQNNETMIVPSRLTKPDVQKETHLETKLCPGRTNGHISLTYTNENRTNSMMSSLTEDYDELAKEKRVYDTVCDKCNISPSQIQSGEKREAKDLQCGEKGAAVDTGVLSNTKNSQAKDKMVSCKTKQSLDNTGVFVDKTKACKSSKYGSQKGSKNKSDINVVPKSNSKQSRTVSDSHKDLNEKVINSRSHSSDSFKLGTERTESRKDNKKSCSASPKLSCKKDTVDYNSRMKNLTENKKLPDTRIQNEKNAVSYKYPSTERTKRYVSRGKVDPILNFDSKEKCKSDENSFEETTVRQVYTFETHTHSKPNTVSEKVTNSEISSANNEKSKRENVERNHIEMFGQNKDIQIPASYIKQNCIKGADSNKIKDQNDSRFETKHITIAKANNKHNGALSGNVSRQNTDHSKTSPVQGRSKQAIYHNIQSFDITVLTKRNNLIGTDTISTDNNRSAEVRPLSKNKRKSFNNRKRNGLIQAEKNTDRKEINTITKSIENSSLIQHEYMAGLHLQRTSSSSNAGVFEDVVKCSDTVKPGKEIETVTSQGNITKQVDKSNDSNQGSQMNTAHEKHSTIPTAGNYHYLCLKENIINDNESTKTKSPMSDRLAISKDRCELLESSKGLKDRHEPALITKPCKSPYLASQPVALQTTSLKRNTHLSLKYPAKEFNISPPAATEAPCLLNTQPSISPACGNDLKPLTSSCIVNVSTDRNKLAVTSSERNTSVLPCAQSASNETDTVLAKHSDSTRLIEANPTKDISSFMEGQRINDSNKDKSGTLHSQEDTFPQLRTILSSDFGIERENIPSNQQNINTVLDTKAESKLSDTAHVDKIPYKADKREMCKESHGEKEKAGSSNIINNAKNKLNTKPIESRHETICAHDLSTQASVNKLRPNSVATMLDPTKQPLAAEKSFTKVDSETAKKLQKFLQKSLDLAHKQKLLTRDSKKNRNQQMHTEQHKGMSPRSIFHGTVFDYNDPKLNIVEDKGLKHSKTVSTVNNNTLPIKKQRRVIDDTTCRQSYTSSQESVPDSCLPEGHSRPLLHRSDSQETVIGGVADSHCTSAYYMSPAEEFIDTQTFLLNSQTTVTQTLFQNEIGLDLTISKRKESLETCETTASRIDDRKDASQCISDLKGPNDAANDSLYESCTTNKIAISKEENMAPLDLTTKNTKTVDKQLLKTTSIETQTLKQNIEKTVTHNNDAQQATIQPMLNGKVEASNVVAKKEAPPSTQETQSEITKTLYQLSQVLQEISTLSESKETNAKQIQNEKSVPKKSHRKHRKSNRKKEISPLLNVKKGMQPKIVSLNSNCNLRNDDTSVLHIVKQNNEKIKQTLGKKTSAGNTNIKVAETNAQTMQVEECKLSSAMDKEDIQVMQDHYKQVNKSNCTQTNITQNGTRNKERVPDINVNPSEVLNSSQSIGNIKVSNAGTPSQIETELSNISMQQAGFNDLNKKQNCILPSNTDIKGTNAENIHPPKHQGNVTTLEKRVLKKEKHTYCFDKNVNSLKSKTVGVVHSDDLQLNRGVSTIKAEPLDFEFDQIERADLQSCKENTVRAHVTTRTTVPGSSCPKSGKEASDLKGSKRYEDRAANCLESLSLCNPLHLQSEKSTQQGDIDQTGSEGEAGEVKSELVIFNTNRQPRDEVVTDIEKNQKNQSELNNTLNCNEEQGQPTNTILSQSSKDKKVSDQQNNTLPSRNSEILSETRKNKSGETKELFAQELCFKSQRDKDDRVNVNSQENENIHKITDFDGLKSKCDLDQTSLENNETSAHTYISKDGELPFVFDCQDEPDVTLLETFGIPDLQTGQHQNYIKLVSSCEEIEKCEKEMSLVKEASNTEQTSEVNENTVKLVSPEVKQAEIKSKTKTKGVRFNAEKGLLNKGGKFVSSIRKSKDVKETVPLVVKLTTVPSQHTTVSLQQTAVPSQQTTVSSQQTTVSSQQTAVSSQQTAVSSQQTTVSSQQTTISSQQATISSQQTTISSQQTTVASQQTKGSPLCEPNKLITQNSDSVTAAKEAVSCSAAKNVALCIDELLKTERMKSDKQTLHSNEPHMSSSSVPSYSNPHQKVNKDDTRKKCESDKSSDRKRSRSLSSSSKERERKRLCNPSDNVGTSESVGNSKNSSAMNKTERFPIKSFKEMKQSKFRNTLRSRLRTEGQMFRYSYFGSRPNVFCANRDGFNRTCSRKPFLNTAKPYVDYKQRNRSNMQNSQSRNRYKKENMCNETRNIKIVEKPKEEAGKDIFVKETNALKQQVVKSSSAKEINNGKRDLTGVVHSEEDTLNDSYNGFDAFKYKLETEDCNRQPKNDFKDRLNKGGTGYLNWRKKYPQQNKRDTNPNKPSVVPKRVLTESERVAERKIAKIEIEQAVRHFRKTYEGTWEDFIADGKVASFLDTITDKLAVIQNKRNKIHNDEEINTVPIKSTSNMQRNNVRNQRQQTRIGIQKHGQSTDKSIAQSTKSPNFSAPVGSLLQEIVKEQFIKKVESVTSRVTKELTERFIEGIGYKTKSASEHPLLNTESVWTNDNKPVFGHCSHEDSNKTMTGENQFHYANINDSSDEVDHTFEMGYPQNRNNAYFFPNQGSFPQSGAGEEKMLAKNVFELARRYATNRGAFRGQLNRGFCHTNRKPDDKFATNFGNKRTWFSKRNHSGRFFKETFADTGKIINQRFCDQTVCLDHPIKFNRGVHHYNSPGSKIRKCSLSSSDTDIEHDDSSDRPRRSNSRDTNRRSFDKTFPGQQNSFEHRRQRSRSNNNLSDNGDRRSSYSRDEDYSISSSNDCNNNRRRSRSNNIDRNDGSHDSEDKRFDRWKTRQNESHSKKRRSYSSDDGDIQEINGGKDDKYNKNNSRRSHSNEKSSNQKRSNSKDSQEYRKRSSSKSSQNDNFSQKDNGTNDHNKRSSPKETNERNNISTSKDSKTNHENLSIKTNNTPKEKNNNRYDQNDMSSEKKHSYDKQDRSHSDHYKMSHRNYYNEHRRRDSHKEDTSWNRKSENNKSEHSRGNFKHNFENRSNNRGNYRGFNRNYYRSRPYHR